MVRKRQLLLHEGVYKELLQLDAAVKAKFVAFQAKFHSDQNLNGLNFERLRSVHELYSARIDRQFRAIMMRVENETFMLLSVLPHDDAYDRIDDRLSVRIRDKSGGMEIHDIQATAEALLRHEPSYPVKRRPERRLFDWVTDREFSDLDLTGPILGSIRLVESESDLAILLTHTDPYTSEVLTELARGTSVNAVMERFTEPVAAEPVDRTDFAAALRRSTTKVVSSDDAVAAMLESEPNAWRLFLHPMQRNIVDRNFDGPARVTGGPGSGKTVVTLHRTARLVTEAAERQRVLLTTFGAALAAELRDKLAQLLDEESMQRVDVVTVDKLALDLATQARPGYMVKRNSDKRLWLQVVGDASESEFDADFLASEWRDVICSQMITTRSEYFTARRYGRVNKLGRAQRARIWKLVERFQSLTDQRGLWGWDQMRVHAALFAEQLSEKLYAHVVVDEAQDMTMSHWRMLRAVVPEQSNDLFIAGDAFQRLYGRALPLSNAGIKVRGRSTRLTMSYRVTEQHLRAAKSILGGVGTDDLDDGMETLTEFRSVLSGPEPQFIPTADRDAELAATVEQVREWLTTDIPAGAIAVSAYTNEQVKQTVSALHKAGIPAEAMGDGLLPGDVVHVSTMHKLKGLEYLRVVITSVGQGFPHKKVRQLEVTDPQAYQQAITTARNLLFVAATRARDTSTIIWHGALSELLQDAVKGSAE
ncbi:UvrD-like helicase family protein [Stackebrandtia albiflava]|uniref:DNA 3'-5' helicase n=1 Tax=Stackebrandtia albiflava TaxID=406432 RepID=A0A562URF3_9ACTN|nr:UvrD-helicase domain-containing protein [Stackebrandtia albiflava]TWJ08205.1 UvrD-like helicase family protein [Stackebrandtia albiflava]